MPNEHYENIYELPIEVSHRISEVAQKLAVAIKKAYKSDGITTRQNNEPAGNQHAFHYHQHIYPRYKDDEFNIGMTQKSILSDPKGRIPYAKKLIAALKTPTSSKTS